MTYDTIIRARLRDLIKRSALSPNALAERMGVAWTTIHRKLRQDGGREQRRPLTTEDIDRIVRAMEEPPDAMLEPVLLAGDMEALRWVQGRSSGVRPDPDQSLRLRLQGLITGPKRAPRLTTLGQRITR